MTLVHQSMQQGYRGQSTTAQAQAGTDTTTDMSPAAVKQATATATAALESNIALNAFRIAVNGALSVQNMVDGFVDEYVDETGVDLVNSVNPVYDAVANSYITPTPLVNAIPAMTSNTTPSGIVSASSANTLSLIYTGVTDTGGMVFASGNITGWFKYEFPVSKVITSYNIKSSGSLIRNPKDWTFEGWDGAAWIVLDTQVGQQFATTSSTLSYAIANTTSYIAYRINITANNGDVTWMQFSKIEMLVDRITTNVSLISNPVTAVTQPTTGNIIVFEEDVDAVTLNTDLIASISRDGGTTYTNVALTDKGNYQSGKRILQGSVGISTQPAGTSMKYKIDTANGKNLNLHGVSLGWK